MLQLIGAAAASAPVHTFTVYTEPLKLRYGEVHNKMVLPQPLPPHVVEEFADGSTQMAISGFDIDIVRRLKDGSEESVALYDAYLHHYILHIGEADGLSALHAASKNLSNRLNSMLPSSFERWRQARDSDGSYVSFGGAAGAEYRHNSHEFKAPYRLLVTKPTTWAPTIHLINTQQPNATPYDGRPSPLLQCPCSPQRVIDPAAGTVDGHAPYPPFLCDQAFLDAGNPSCSLEKYKGGWRCCEDGVFLIDTRQCKQAHCEGEPQATWFLKMNFTYESVAAGSTAVRPMEATACCDVTSTWQGDANIEYDVLQCAPGTPPSECVQVTSSVQPLAYYSARQRDLEGRALVQLNYAAPHLHLGAISLSLEDAVTNETICKVSVGDRGVSYGTSARAGDEKNYLTGLRPCVWGGDQAKRFERRHPMRSVAVYNASQTLTGVMSLWLMTAAEVRDTPACEAEMQAAGCLGSSSSKCFACAESHAAKLYAAGCQDDMAAALCKNAPTAVERK